MCASVLVGFFLVALVALINAGSMLASGSSSESMVMSCEVSLSFADMSYRSSGSLRGRRGTQSESVGVTWGTGEVERSDLGRVIVVEARRQGVGLGQEKGRR